MLSNPHQQKASKALEMLAKETVVSHLVVKGRESRRRNGHLGMAAAGEGKDAESALVREWGMRPRP